MHRKSACTLTAVVCLALASCSNDADPVDESAEAEPLAGESETPDPAANVLDGRWTGSWGGGAQGDVVFQPVLVELVIEGDRVELSGFPDAAELSGTISNDTDAGRIVITDGETQILEYRYELDGDDLTLIDGRERTIDLLRRRPETSDREGPPVP